MRSVVVTLALALSAANAHAQVKPGRSYDRISDTTSWVVGRLDQVHFHGAGAGPSCATAATIVLRRMLSPAFDQAAASAELARADRPVARVLIDSTRLTIEGRALRYVAPGLFGEAEVQWRYVVPDSLVGALARASILEAVDDRGGRISWSQRQLRAAPPICGAAP